MRKALLTEQKTTTTQAQLLILLALIKILTWNLLTMMGQEQAKNLQAILIKPPQTLTK